MQDLSELWPSSLREKCPNTDFSGPYFPVFNQKTGKYGTEKIPYLDTFHEVHLTANKINLHMEQV